MAEKVAAVPEKVLTLGLRKKLVGIHRTRRRSRAIDLIREGVARFSKVSPESVRIDGRLNSFAMQSTGTRMRKLKLRINRDGELTRVSLFEQKPASTANVVPKKEEPKKETKKEEKKPEQKPQPKK